MRLGLKERPAAGAAGFPLLKVSRGTGPLKACPSLFPPPVAQGRTTAAEQTTPVYFPDQSCGKYGHSPETFKSQKRIIQILPLLHTNPISKPRLVTRTRVSFDFFFFLNEILTLGKAGRFYKDVALQEGHTRRGTCEAVWERSSGTGALQVDPGPVSNI